MPKCRNEHVAATVPCRGGIFPLKRKKKSTNLSFASLDSVKGAREAVDCPRGKGVVRLDQRRIGTRELILNKLKFDDVRPEKWDSGSPISKEDAKNLCYRGGNGQGSPGGEGNCRGKSVGRKTGGEP